MADMRARRMMGCQQNMSCNNYGNRRAEQNMGCADSSCRAWMRKLQMIDFALADTILYLDAYPECKQALAYYHKLKAEREQLMQAGRGRCGAVCARENESTEHWQWTQGPWPWHPDAN